MSVLILLALRPSHAQINTSITLSEKHQKQLGNIEDPDKKLTRYKKFYKKDSVKFIKRLEKLWQHKSDSLTKVLSMPNEVTEGAEQVKEIKEKNPSLRRDEVLERATAIGDEQLSKIDEVEQAKEIKKEVEEYTRQRTDKAGEINGYVGNINQLPDSLKSLKNNLTNAENLTEKLEQEAVKHTDLADIQKQQKELEALKSTPDKYTQQMDKLKDHKAMQDQLKKKAILKSAELFKEHGDKLQAAQNKLSKLKKKYSTVLNSNDLSTAIKRKSLKGEPLKKRVYISGNFQIISTDPVSLDASPMLGYRFDKKLTVGISGTFRHTFGSYKPGVNISENMAGYGTFISYDVVKSFFAYGEGERMNIEVKDPLTDLKHREWVSGIHAGIGRTFNFSKILQSQVLFLYNFSHKGNKELYPRKFIVKVGFALRR